MTQNLGGRGLAQEEESKFQSGGQVFQPVERSDAPKLGEFILLVEATKLTEKGHVERIKFTVPVLSVVSYSPKHDIWEVRVPLRPYHGGDIEDHNVNTWIWVKKDHGTWKVVNEPAE